MNLLNKKCMLLFAMSFAYQILLASSFGNPFVWGNNRMTIITPTLLRLEYSKNGEFIDAPTLFASERNNSLSTDQIKVKELGDNCYEITTSALRIWYRNDGYPFSTSNLAVFYMRDGKERKFTNRFILKNNLGGPVETLDRVTTEIPMNDGLLSRDGWYIIDDARADLVVNGWLKPRDTSNSIQDQYCFIYGNDYKAALASLGAISGKVPMTRKYIHGVWYCRYWDYTSEEFLDIINGYDKHDFPLDNIVFDMGWHTNDAAVGTGHNGHKNWTGYTWNTELIPNPKALIDSIHNRGITVSLNDHPHDGLRPHETYYSAFMGAMGAKSDELLLFDPSNEKYMTNFFKYAHQPSEDLGVDFWWLDWQQNYLYPYVHGTNTTTLAWLNELYYRNSKRENKRGCNYSRWSGFGDHKHPIQFSGDAQANWEMLAFEVKLTACSGNGGCYYWAHDIGGFRGEPNPELTARWTQFGALSAALRVHSTKDPRLDRRPWLNDDFTANAIRKAYHLRSQLIPYIYSSVWQTHSTMIPLNRCMFIDYTDQKESFDNPQEFMFGDIILAAPISSPGTGENKVASQKVWFPKGDVWYDFFTHEKIKGGETRNITKSLDEFPMYIKGGWVLPMQPYTNRPTSTPLSCLILRTYPALDDVSNSFILYEDDGISLDYEKGKYTTTELNYTQKNKKVIIAVKAASGSYDGQQTKRSYKVQLPNECQLKTVKVDGRSVATIYDEAVNCYIVDIPVRSVHKSVIVEYQLN